MTTFWSFVFVLSGLIFVHELGHYLVARKLGIKVLKFSIGFGPRVWGVVAKGTDYCISAIPLGGFVKMLGEKPNDEVNPQDEPVSFSHRPVSHRAAVVAAGPLFNFLFAWLIVFVILLIMGNPVMLPETGSVQDNSPASRAGIMAGDRVTGINNIPVDTWGKMSKLIKQSPAGHPIDLELLRDGRTLHVKVTPEIRTIKSVFGEDVKVPLIGITASGKIEIRPATPLSAAWLATQSCWEMATMIFKGIVKLFQQVVPLSALGGPIMIAQMAGEQAQQGAINLFYFMALLSVNLGLLNLMPIPVLDGGHLFLLAAETVTGQRLSQKQMQIVYQTGMLILGSLMLLVFYNDIMRMLGMVPAFPHP